MHGTVHPSRVVTDHQYVITYLTLGAHAQRGFSLMYMCVCVSLCVCYHASEGIARLYSKMEIRTALGIGFSRFQEYLLTATSSGEDRAFSGSFKV